MKKNTEYLQNDPLHYDFSDVSCYNWLNSFDGWRDFVKKNFIQDFDEFFKNAWQTIEKKSQNDRGV